MKQVYVCEHCGRENKIPLHRIPTNAYQGQRANFGSGLPSSFSLAEYLQPARPAAVDSDVHVPLLQAAVSGFAIGLLSIWPGWYFAWDWLTPMGLAGVTFAGTWLFLLSDHRRALWNIERISGRDIDGDGRIGPDPEPVAPPPQIHRVEVTEQRPGQFHRQYFDLPAGIDYDKMKAIATAINLPGGSFSRPYLCATKGLLTQTEYNQLRQRFLAAGMVITSSNKTELTGSGRAMVKSYLE